MMFVVPLRFAGDVQTGDLVKVADTLDSDNWSPVVSVQPTITTGECSLVLTAPSSGAHYSVFRPCARTRRTAYL